MRGFLFLPLTGNACCAPARCWGGDSDRQRDMGTPRAPTPLPGLESSRRGSSGLVGARPGSKGSILTPCLGDWDFPQGSTVGPEGNGSQHPGPEPAGSNRKTAPDPSIVVTQWDQQAPGTEIKQGSGEVRTHPLRDVFPLSNYPQK